jgi:hypothetical protein
MKARVWFNIFHSKVYFQLYMQPTPCILLAKYTYLIFQYNKTFSWSTKFSLNVVFWINYEHGFQCLLNRWYETKINCHVNNMPNTQANATLTDVSHTLSKSGQCMVRILILNTASASVYISIQAMLWNENSAHSIIPLSNLVITVCE